MERIAPDPVVPTPAAQFAELRGRRVIIGVPGVGFRGDMRADNAVLQGGRTFVPVITEQDYYRAEIDQVEVFAPLVPIDRVWVEDISSDTHIDSAALDSPPIRRARPAKTVPVVMGKRVIQTVADGFARDLRAISEAYLSAEIADCVRVCAEPDWYRWALTGMAPRSIEVAATSLWIE